MNRLLRLAAAAAAAAIAVAACSSGDESSAAAPSVAATTSVAAPTTSARGGADGTSAGEDSGTITVQNFSYGDPITVAPGATIKVTNQDVAAHDAVSDDGKFTTPLLKQGESATFTAPMQPGTYKFSCSVHASMTGIGTLTVSG
ncbi:MAG TPA: cupredoxin domain-containing protein [Mycobacteriales bacterium]